MGRGLTAQGPRRRESPVPEKYILDKGPEIDRLERQAALVGHDRVRDHLSAADGQSILDAGAGSGWVSRLIARTAPGAQVTGIDISPDFVAYAARRAAEEGLGNLSHRVGDITALPFESDSFDLVWSQFVVFFLPHPERAIAEFARVTRPGGCVTVAVTDSAFQTIWPARPELSRGIAALREAALHGWRCEHLPHMMRAAGLAEARVEIVTDRVYSFTAGASPAQRRNIEESFLRAMLENPDLVGGPDRAARLAQDLLDFVDDPESAAFGTHWIVSARKPLG